MALQVSKTLSNGAVASYWRIVNLRSEFSDDAPTGSNGGSLPKLFVDVKGYHDSSYRASNSVLDGATFVLTSGFFNDSSASSGIAPGWSQILADGSVTSGDPRPAIYDWLKSDTGGVQQAGHLFSGAVDV